MRQNANNVFRFRSNDANCSLGGERRPLPLSPVERPQRTNNILTSATEPYDLSLSRSFQNLSRLPPSCQLKSDLIPLSHPSLKRITTTKDVDEFYPRKHHHPDFGVQGPTHMVKLSADPQQRQRPRRVQRTMSQDHVLSPPRTPRHGNYGLSSYGAMAANAYSSSRHLSDEQLLSADRLHSQDPLLSPVMRRDKFREKAMARAMSHADMLLPLTPVADRHRMTKMHSQPSASNDSYNTLTVIHPASASKRQAFASRRTHTVDHLQFIPGHHHTYRTASKNEVTV
uniref:Shisa family member 6 n=1 Tax=Mola mola TaxID=94237 RepID=A0A3Q3XPF1_MOLML